MQCVIGAILAAGSLVLPESPRCVVLLIHHHWRLIICSWLIDVDRDNEGMRVIVDLHGGDPEDLVAKAEFHEIKQRVISEVMFFFNEAAARTEISAA